MKKTIKRASEASTEIGHEENPRPEEERLPVIEETVKQKSEGGEDAECAKRAALNVMTGFVQKCASLGVTDEDAIMKLFLNAVKK